MNKDLKPDTNSIEIVTSESPKQLRYFWVVMASVFPFIALVGFSFDYIMIFNSNIKPHWFSHLHGVIMTGWLALFFAQTLLVVKSNLKFHRQLGLLSAGWGLLVWLSMIIAFTRPMVIYPPPIDDWRWDMLLLHLYGTMLFGLFFTWGILVRKKAAAHKRLLFFATLITISAAIDRIRFLPLINEVFTIRFIYLDALMIPLLVYDLTTLRKIHKTTIIACLIIITVQFGVANSMGSRAWHTFWFNRLAPFVEQVVEVKLSDSQIEPLLGNYGDKNWYMRIFRENGKIYLQVPNAPQYEMAAMNENKWFLRAMYWQVSFIRGDDGKVVKIINTQPDITWEAQRYNETLVEPE
jgi:hypothetical protein